MSRFFCGACGWNYWHWRGVFYPEELRTWDWLGYYAQFFDTVEINASFYRLPERKTFERWRKATPDGFVFAVKASRYLTHVKKLVDPEEPLQRLLEHSEGLGEKRGPILFQFPPSWEIDLDRLEQFLRILPPGLRTAFEFRNSTWHTEELWDLLSRYGAAYCMMDSPGLPLHIRRTADFAYLRMHSGGEEQRGNYTDEALAVWAERIRRMLEDGDFYVYFNNDIHGYAVQNALTLRKMVLGE
ncbi:MAG: DUF72 domain-containing protein [Armatimonadota bacterium]|nr:DUF72 domain-containing protein [Armatimonadota bacterium]